MSYNMIVFVIISAIILDWILGDPINWPHPIVYMGKLISFFEKTSRKYFPNNLKICGFVLAFLSLIIVAFISETILILSKNIHYYIFIAVCIYMTYTTLAAKCLNDEVLKIYESLKNDNIQLTRIKIGYLVGRDTSSLDTDEIIRASIETAAENIIDGVLAPIFYFFIGSIWGHGVTFALMYKLINTIDSMIGYKNDKYGDIGYCGAKLDDIVNYIPARIGSISIILSAIFKKYQIIRGFKIMIRDHKNHKSPNCGYPEAAVAGLLDIQLGGTNIYFGEVVYKPTLGDKIEKLELNHIKKTCVLIKLSEIVFTVIIISLGVIISEQAWWL